jgi:hypothetical protein
MHIVENTYSTVCHLFVADAAKLQFSTYDSSYSGDSTINLK